MENLNIHDNNIEEQMFINVVAQLISNLNVMRGYVENGDFELSTFVLNESRSFTNYLFLVFLTDKYRNRLNSICDCFYTPRFNFSFSIDDIDVFIDSLLKYIPDDHYLKIFKKVA